MLLIHELQKLKETRSHINQVYPVIEVAFLVISAMICGQNKWTEIKEFGEGNIDWLRQYLPYENGIPTRHNIAAIMRTIVPETLLSALIGWVNLHRENNGTSIISIDGKVVKGAKASKDAHPLFMVAAYEIEQGLVLTHQACEGKGKEITTIKEMLRSLNIEQCLLTADALHCQVETIKQVINQGGHLLVQVKKNQKNLYSEVDAQFQSYWALSEKEQISHHTDERKHGRHDVRDTYVLPANFSDKIREKWSDVRSIIAVVRDRSINGKGSYTTSYYICTDLLNINMAAKATRSHWHIENKHHWSLDVIFKEDEQQIYAGDSALNMVCCRRFVQNIFRLHPEKISVPRKMSKAIWDPKYRADVLFT